MIATMHGKTLPAFQSPMYRATCTYYDELEGIDSAVDRFLGIGHV